MSRFWSPIVHGLTPYVAGEQPALADLVKLNTNENPYGPSPRALAAIRAAATDELRLYPEPTALRLRTAIAASHGLGPEQVFIGNGSDEVLAHAFQALFRHEAPLLFACGSGLSAVAAPPPPGEGSRGKGAGTQS